MENPLVCLNGMRMGRKVGLDGFCHDEQCRRGRKIAIYGKYSDSGDGLTLRNGVDARRHFSLGDRFQGVGDTLHRWEQEWEAQS